MTARLILIRAEMVLVVHRMTIEIAFVIGYHSPAIEALRSALTRVDPSIRDRVLVVSPQQSLNFLDVFRRCRAIVLYTHELPQQVENAIKENTGALVVSISESFSHLNRCSVDVLRDVALYFKYGGPKNLANLVEYVAHAVGLLDREVEPPEPTPWHGVWHPKLGLFTDVKSYLEKYYAANKPLVGILFYRTMWLYNTLEPIKALVEALESEGLGVVPVFTTGYRNELTGEPSAEDTIRKFFIVDGRPLIELLIDMLSFFLLDHGRSREWSKRFDVVSGVELLKYLNVPVIKPVRDFYKDVEAWARDEQGVSYLAQVYEVIMPEVDGVAEPIFFVGSKDMGDYRVPQPFYEHAKYIARRVRRWVELRRKRPSERRIAIVLNNPPCKMVEATIGVGLGLDVPESVVRLLHRLKELGYYLGEEPLPKSGQELIKLFLERRATSEFRWTSVEDIVSRGGYLDMVDIDTYMKWFEELPEDVRKRMIEVWGDPRDVVSGKVSKLFAGAVYNGKFVVPGLRFGNIVIVPQPKFGCAGPVCDGRACKILHDPTVPPPHQWLAVYRWITRVFRADVVIHFGTHGYLEFRPGKGVGLSPSCWPEISIDDVPFLYVYVVSNPMEGVIAKRRGYAVLVDHVYPPMMEAIDGLAELDELLEQYSRAKRLGEEGRAKAIYGQILDLVKKLGLPVNVDEEPDKVVSELHRFLDLVRGSQVEQGLHIFGNTPRDPKKLAEHVVAIMKFDTHAWRSILRAVAVYMGLDYDEIRSRPDGFCEKLGMSNRKVMELLYRVAIDVVEKLLRDGVDPRDLTWETLNSALEEAIRRHLGAPL